MKTSRQKLFIAFLLLAMLLMYGSLPSATQATSMKSVSDTISSSDVSAPNVTHTIVASTTQDIPANGHIDIVFPVDFTNLNSGNLTCPGGGGAGGPVNNTLTCTYATGLTKGNYTITVTGVTNPGYVGSQMFTIDTKNNTGTLLDNSTFRVAIVNHVTVTATVQASLTFTITGVGTTSPTYVNGILCNASSTYNTLAYGILAPNVEKTICQRMNVTTNANYGYTVTVMQNQNLTASNGATIAAFKDGAAASTTPLIWAAPSAVLGSYNTYGHFGFTSGDSSLSNGNPFVGSKYKGFWHVTPVEVMYNNGPSDGLTSNIGSSTVAYSIQISALQPAGDYTNQLTYVCTPTY